MIVVDATVMVMALAGPSERAESARSALFADDDWAAPAHMPLEVAGTLHKAAITNRMTPADAEAAFRALTAMRIAYVETDALLLDAIWRLRQNVSIYDATYLAVAALHGATVVTFDARLAEGASLAMPEIDVTVL